MTAPTEPRPWFKPGMSAADIAVWEAAERAAAEAPALGPADDVRRALGPLLRNWLTQPAEQQRGAA